MRRQHFAWTYIVLSLVLTIYGTYSLIYNHVKGRGLSILGLVFLIIGSTLLIIFFTLLIISHFKKKKALANSKVIETEVKEAEPEEVKEVKPEPKEEAKKPVEEKKTSTSGYTPRKSSSYSSSRSSSSFSGGDAYIKQVGYGPVLRVNGQQILDMRSNTYYQIEGNMVHMHGSGPVFEISGNRIRLAYGSYLYEISGDSVNKIYGGYFASISGGYIQTYDLSQKFEISGDLNLKQKLAVVALLFGAY